MRCALEQDLRHSQRIFHPLWRRLRGLRRCISRWRRPITGPASISAAMLVPAGTARAVLRTRIGSTFGTTTNTSFLGGGQVGVNYQFYGGVVIGAEAMFDWVPNTSNTINATNTGLHRDRRGDDQQSMAVDRDRQARLCLGPSSALRQGRWRLGRDKQSFDYGRWGTQRPFTSSSSNNFGWTAGLGVEWAFAGNWSARAEWDYVRLQDQSFTVAGPAQLRWRRDQRKQSQHQYVHRRPELQIRRRLVVIARTVKKGTTEGVMTPSRNMDANDRSDSA